MHPTRVKICGITRVEDADYAASAGADAIGIVFYPPSSRYVSDLGLAKEVAQAAGPFVTVVGLFVDAPSDELEKVLSSVPLNMIQFHGDETESVCSQFRLPYMKALRMKNNLDVEELIAKYSSASAILLDTYVKGAPGGTGKVFDWGRVPSDVGQPIVVAGGLTPDNVADAIAQSKPYGVDVSGGVETSPGIKSAEKINVFVKQAKLEY